MASHTGCVLDDGIHASYIYDVGDHAVHDPHIRRQRHMAICERLWSR